MKLQVLSYMIVFLIGFISCILAQLIYSNAEMPLGFGFSSNLEAPSDWIKESQIHVYKNAIVIDVDEASISRYAPTGSMIPVLDEDSTGIRIKPEKAEDIKVGDIVSFEQDGQLIVHRVVEIGKDEQGTYFITKGDNNNITDGKIRFSQIKYITIGILW